MGLPFGSNVALGKYWGTAVCRPAYWRVDERLLSLLRNGSQRILAGISNPFILENTACA